MALAGRGENEKQMEVLNSFQLQSATTTTVVHDQQAAFPAFCQFCGSKKTGGSLAKFCSNCGGKYT